MKRIALIVKTDGLEYDDRIRKEMVSAQKVADVKFKIFVMLKENVDSEGMTTYGVPFRSVFIPAREKYPSASHTLLKAWQFYQAIKKEIKEYDAVWCADIGTELTALLVRNNRLLFDCHEIPTHLVNSKVGRFLVRMLFGKCRLVLHANPQRIDYLHSIGLISDKHKHIALRNYPDSTDEPIIDSVQWQDFLKWVNGRKCVYLQGLVDKSRAAYESVKAVLETEDLSAVVIGKFDAEALNKLKEENEADLKERIFFTGKIPQAAILQYVRECKFSMVFYKNVRANNWYCEANRFYLATSSGLPVITGNNPPMKDLVEKYNLGIAIDDDGRDLAKIQDSISTLMDKYDAYAASTKAVKDVFCWISQDNTIKAIVEELVK